MAKIVHIEKINITIKIQIIYDLFKFVCDLLKFNKTLKIVKLLTC